jgi:predicted HD phosphohydrolase
MTKQHLITPPPELVQEWVNTYFGGKISQSNFHSDLATRAAQWGSDQELEACCALLQQKGVPAWSLLRMHRRPKPQSLKEQAIQALELFTSFIESADKREEADIIRRALEQLDD